MRRSGSIGGVAVVLAAAFAGGARAAPLQCVSQWEQLSKARQTGGLTRKAFMASCLSGAAPASVPVVDASPTAPSGASYRCRDGMYAVTPSGCSIHRGVAARLR